MPRPTFFNLPRDKRERLIALALEEFSANDYESASLSRVVARAGIAKGSAYQYFDDKADLYLYLVELARQRKSEYMAQRPMPKRGMDMFAYLRWLMEESVGFELAHPQLARLGYRFMSAPQMIKARAIGQAQADAQAYFVKLTRQAIRQGSVRKDVDPRVAAFLFSAVFAQLADFLFQYAGLDAAALARGPGRITRTKRVMRAFDQIMTMLERGMAVAPTRPAQERERR